MLTMELPFLDRTDELRRLSRVLKGKNAGSLVVLYGRRRCGKSRLLQQVIGPGDIYFLADEREKPLQIQALAVAVDAILPGFSSVRYPSWPSLFETLSARLRGKHSLFLDEFPYLVRQAPELPSVLQREIDRPGPKNLNWVLCGSSQRMMQGLVLDRTAPLFGRSREAIPIRPLPAGWIAEALHLDGASAVEAFSVWGGVPRYWELAAEYGSTRDAVLDLILDRNGVLHSEPKRLLLEDMRTAVQASSILLLIGSGCHRISEIAARLGKPAGSLTRAISNLIELGLVTRDVPWGENARSTKRTLYRLGDPFLSFHTRFVEPYQALLELGRTGPVLERFDGLFHEHVSSVWEELARASVPGCRLGGIDWAQASRWWGTGMDGRPLELDVVAESLDGKSLLVGEAKWNVSSRDLGKLAQDLENRVARFPGAGGRQVVQAVWLKSGRGPHGGTHVLAPQDALQQLM